MVAGNLDEAFRGGVAGGQTDPSGLAPAGPVDEVMDVVALYRRDHQGWNVKYFHSWYQREHEGAGQAQEAARACAIAGYEPVGSAMRGDHACDGVEMNTAQVAWCSKSDRF